MSTVEVKAADVKPGMKIRTSGGWGTVTENRKKEGAYNDIYIDHDDGAKSSNLCPAATKFKVQA